MPALIPTFDAVLIQPFDGVTSKSILIPDSVKENRRGAMGLVRAIGPDVKTESVNVGDKVAFSWYEAEQIEHDGFKLVLVKQNRVLAKLRDEPKANPPASE